MPGVAESDPRPLKRARQGDVPRDGRGEDVPAARAADSSSSSRPSPAPPATTAVRDKFAALVKWAQEGSVGSGGEERKLRGVSNLRIGPSSLVGGGSALHTIGAIGGDGGGHNVIAEIPQACVLSAAKAAKSSFGRAVASTHGLDCTDEFCMWMWMAIGRRDPAHPFHAYLASLPEAAPDGTLSPVPARAYTRSGARVLSVLSDSTTLTLTIHP